MSKPLRGRAAAEAAAKAECTLVLPWVPLPDSLAEDSEDPTGVTATLPDMRYVI
jgi:hypothetical protein